MKKEKDYLQDIAEIRSMMERSTKFMSLSGWAGIMAGIYALAGAWIMVFMYDFNPDAVVYAPQNMSEAGVIAAIVLFLALDTAFIFSKRKAKQRNEPIWSHTSKQLLVSMGVPLVAGGVLILFLFTEGLSGLAAPLTLFFYGLALFNAGYFTIPEVRIMGYVQLLLGLAAVWFIEYSMLFWALGFGVAHIIYGVYMYLNYERR